MLDLSWGRKEGVDTSRSEYKARLVAGGPGWAAGLAASPVLGETPEAWDTRLGHIIREELETAGGDNLLPVPDPDDEGARSAAEHQEGAIVGPLQGQDYSATAHPDQGGA